MRVKAPAQVTRDGPSIRDGRSSHSEINGQPPGRNILLEEDMSEDDTGSDVGNGVSLNPEADYEVEPVFKVNEEYARRFEHNKKREELHRRECYHLAFRIVIDLICALA